MAANYKYIVLLCLGFFSIAFSQDSGLEGVTVTLAEMQTQQTVNTNDANFSDGLQQTYLVEFPLGSTDNAFIDIDDTQISIALRNLAQFNTNTITLNFSGTYFKKLTAVNFNAQTSSVTNVSGISSNFNDTQLTIEGLQQNFSETLGSGELAVLVFDVLAEKTLDLEHHNPLTHLQFMALPNHTLIVKGKVPSGAQLTLYTLDGKTLYQHPLLPATTNRIKLPYHGKGLYIASIESAAASTAKIIALSH